MKIDTVEEYKAQGRYRHAGQLAALQGDIDYYGCHFGMRSTLDAARAAFHAGFKEIEDHFDGYKVIAR